MKQPSEIWESQSEIVIVGLKETDFDHLSND